MDSYVHGKDKPVAGDWIKIREDLPDDPTVGAIAEHLGLTPDHVVGLLVRFWSWVGRHYENGHASVRSVSASRHVREPHFHEALLKVGWMKEDPDGNFYVPQWDRHNSQSAKNRALDAERKRRDRSQKSPVRVRTKPGPEKRREEKSKETSNDVSLRRVRDEIWDVVVELFYAGVVTDAQRSGVGEIVSNLKQRHATPEEVRAVARQHERKWPGLTVTGWSVMQHWGELKPRRNGVTRSAPQVVQQPPQDAIAPDDAKALLAERRKPH